MIPLPPKKNSSLFFFYLLLTTSHEKCSFFFFCMCTCLFVFVKTVFPSLSSVDSPFFVTSVCFLCNHVKTCMTLFCNLTHWPSLLCVCICFYAHMHTCICQNNLCVFFFLCIWHIKKTTNTYVFLFLFFFFFDISLSFYHINTHTQRKVEVLNVSFFSFFERATFTSSPFHLD